LTQKLFFRLVTLSMGHVPPPMRVLSYRRKIFGAHFLDCLTRGMRHADEWSIGETELFAAFVSKLNRCEY
ncbi:MAG: hypothetical protein AAF387_18810, partial [Pseudomonadota bacterium]